MKRKVRIKSIILWVLLAVFCIAVTELIWSEYNGIALDEQGNAYIGSVAGMNITKVDLETGETTEYLSFPSGSADDLEFGDDGRLYFTDLIGGKIKAVDANGNVETIVSGIIGANSLDFDGSGTLYVAADFLGDGLFRIDSEQKSADVINQVMHGLNGFEIKDGFLYGPLWFDGQIVKLSLETGQVVEILADGLVQPSAVNLNSERHYICSGWIAGESISD